MGNGPSSNASEERVFTDEGMGAPWAGDRARLVISIDIGATHSAVVLAFLQPSKTTIIFEPLKASKWSQYIYLSDTVPSIHRISHWRGQESQLFDGKVPSLLQYTAPPEVRVQKYTLVLEHTL